MARVALILLLLSSAVLAEEHVIETEHYRLTSDGPREQADEYALVLEAAYEGFAKFFKATPKLKKDERLAVRHFTTREAWEAALRADGITPPKAGGYYAPGTKTAYLYRQGTVYYSRVLLVHEASHQFHYLARTRNKNPDSFWYTEGLAEYLSWHHWDGEELELAVLPLVSLKDYAAAALKEARQKGFDLDNVLEGKNAPTRAMAWALCRWLATGEKARKFGTLRKKVDGGARAAPTFRKTIGRPKKVKEPFLAWLEKEQEPFAYVFNEWFGIGPGRLRGFFLRGTSICRLEPAATTFRATLDVPADKASWCGGVVLHYTSNEDYSIGVVDQNGRVTRRHWNGSVFDTTSCGKTEGPYTFELTRSGATVTLKVGGKEFGAWEVEGTSGGLAVAFSDLTFRDVSWR